MHTKANLLRVIRPTDDEAAASNFKSLSSTMALSCILSLALVLPGCGSADAGSAALADNPEAVADAGVTESDVGDLAANDADAEAKRVAARRSSSNNSSGSGSTSSSSTSSGSTSTSTSPAATSTSPVVTTGAINSLETILSDMKLKHDLKIAGIPNPTAGWNAGPGVTGNGNDPRGSNVATYWQPSDSSYRSSTYWNQLAPWSEVFIGEGNAASNTRVQMRNWVVYWQKKSDLSWNVLATVPGSFGDFFTASYGWAGSASSAHRKESEGWSWKPQTGAQTFVHAYSDNFLNTIPEPANIRAIMVTVEYRLVLDNASGTDDRAKAKYMLRIGADYYPRANLPSNWAAPMGFIPAVVGSRAKLATNNWQSLSAFTFGPSVVYQDNASGNSGITEAEFRASPPPLR